jgi:hypothetical protein
MVSAKGKGLMQTYWLTLKAASSSVTVNNASDSTHIVQATEKSCDFQVQEDGSTEMFPSDAPRTQRLIEWNVDVLQRQLKKIIAMRNASFKNKSSQKSSESDAS